LKEQHGNALKKKEPAIGKTHKKQTHQTQGPHKVNNKTGHWRLTENLTSKLGNQNVFWGERHETPGSKSVLGWDPTGRIHSSPSHVQDVGGGQDALLAEPLTTLPDFKGVVFRTVGNSRREVCWRNNYLIGANVIEKGKDGKPT